MTQLQPVSNSQRLVLLDALRGFALLGILMINILYISYPFFQYSILKIDYWNNPLSDATVWFVHFFSENKFYSIFSFLFGVGFYLQESRGEDKRNMMKHFVRRYSILLLIGIVHVLLLWPGDILVMYSFFGMLLIFFRKREPMTILIWVIVMLLIPVLLNASFYFAAKMDSGMLQQLQSDYDAVIVPDMKFSASQSMTSYLSNSFSNIFHARMKDALNYYSSLPFWMWNSFAMFLLGLYVGKKRVLENIEIYKSKLNRLLLLTGIVGVVGNIIWTITYYQMNLFVPSLAGLVNAIVFPFAIPSLSCFLVLLVIKLYQRKSSMIDYMAAAGMMALTNYVMQSFVCNILFFGIGFSLYGKVPPHISILIVISIWILQMFISKLYFKRFKYGPLEFVWRKLTYGKL